MIARKRETLLSFGMLALLGACTEQRSNLSAAPPARPEPAKAQPSSPPPAPEGTLATAPSSPPSAEVKAPPPLVPAVRSARARPSAESECKKCNGAWGVHGLSKKPQCNCRTSDAGKRCRDGVECEALCVAGDEPEREVVDPGPPPRGSWVGKCSEFVTVFGCYRPIEDGAGAKPVELTEPPQMICVD